MGSSRRTELPDLWLTAAVAGSLWASVEIIVGSFLHNLRVPLAGTLLAATGVGLLTGAHQIWPQPGLFWRAGLICALMKSVSPTAVVLGPMVGILTESLLLEIATRLLGRTALAYAVGGALATSWPLVQKILSLIITFGPNVVTLYVKLCEYAERTLRLPLLGPVEILATVAGLHLLLGAVVALSAVRVGRRSRTSRRTVAVAEQPAWHGFKLDARQKFSMVLLVVDLMVLAAALLLLEAYPLWAALAAVPAFTVWVAIRYPSALRRFRKPRLWLELGGLMMLSGLLLGAGRNGGSDWAWGGLREGFQMILRAWLIITGFAAVSVELRNPRIIEWFTRRRLRHVPEALGVAFEALPTFAAALAEQRRLLRRPLSALSELLAEAGAWLEAYRWGQALPSRVFILIGDAGQGKTTAVAAVCRHLRECGFAVGGVLAHGIWRDGKRWGFDVEDLLDGRRRPLCRRDADEGRVVVGPFRFLAEGLDLGREALSLDRLRAANVDAVIVDEIGPLELAAQGWAESLDALVAEWPGPMLWVVRRSLVDEVVQRWLPARPPVWDVASSDPAQIAQAMAAQVELGVAGGAQRGHGRSAG